MTKRKPTSAKSKTKRPIPLGASLYTSVRLANDKVRKLEGQYGETIAEIVRDAYEEVSPGGDEAAAAALELIEAICEGDATAHTGNIMTSTALSGDRGLVAGVDEVRESRAEKSLLALLAWAYYSRIGEPGAFKILPFLFWIDCAFFLRFTWVRGLIASLHTKDQPAELSRLFFGRKGRSGGGRLSRTLDNFKTDLLVFAEVQKLRQDGSNLDEALSQVADASLKLTGQKRAVSTIESIYRKIRSTPLSDPISSFIRD